MAWTDTSRRVRWLVVLTTAAALVLPGWAPASASGNPATVYDTTMSMPAYVASGLTLPAYDGESDPLTATIVTQPTHGTVDSCADVTCTFTPEAGFVGHDSFTFRVNDGTSDSSLATVSLNVYDPDGPSGSDSSPMAVQEVASPITVLAYGYSAMDFSVVNPPNHGTLGAFGAPDCSSGYYCQATAYYTSEPGVTDDSFTWQASMNGHPSIPATATIAVVPPTIPIAYDTNGYGNLDAPFDVAMAVYDGGDGQALTVLPVTQPTHASVTCTHTVCHVTPDSGFIGRDSFTFQATDGTNTTDTKTAFLQVIDPAAPTSQDANAQVVDSTPSPVTVVGYGYDSPMDFEIVDPPAHGTLGSFATPDCSSGYYCSAKLNYTSDAGATSDSFTYRVSYAGHPSLTGTVTLNVVAPTVPVAYDNTLGAYNDRTTDFNLSAYDGGDGQALSGIIVTPPAHGTVTCDSGTILCHLTPDAGYVGYDSLTFRATDGTNTTNLATLTISVYDPLGPSSNDVSPTVVEHIATTLSLSAYQNTSGDTVSIQIITPPTHGTLGTFGTPDCSSGYFCTSTVDYTSDTGATTDSFVFRAVENGHRSLPYTATITVVPYSVPVTYGNSGSTTVDTAALVYLYGYDADGQTDTADIVTQPAHGHVSDCGTPAYYYCTYTPDPGFVGKDTFTYREFDGTSYSNVSTFTMDVYDPDAPTAYGGYSSVEGTTPTDLVLQATRAPDGSAPVFAIVNPPNHGSLGAIGPVTCDPTYDYYCSATVSYTSDAGATADQFDFDVRSGTHHSEPATYTLDVRAPVRPVAYDDTFSGLTNQDVSIWFYGYDPDGDPVTAVVDSGPSHGTLHDCSSDHTSCTYTPATDFVGTDTITWHSSDGARNSDPATVTINVADPGAPTADSHYGTAVTTTTRTLHLTGYSPSGMALAFSIVTPPSLGTLGTVGTPTCSGGSCTALVDYTAPATPGDDSFTYRVTDTSSRSSVPATYSVTVEDPRAPTAYPVTQDVQGDATTSVMLSGDDQLDHPLTFHVVSGPSHGTLAAIGTPDCSGYGCTASVDYTPTAAYRGDDSFTYTVSNGTLTSAPATVTLRVVDAPCAGQTVTNGTVLLGVNCIGDLNVGQDGLKYVPTGNDSTSPGCPCEGWGVADETSGVTGYADESTGTSTNLHLVSYTHTADSAVSVVDIGTTFRVTQDYHPSSATPNAYEVTTSVKNLTGASTHLRYRRVMDWDIMPTAFSEYVTMVKGSSPNLVFTSDNGFASADALSGPSDLGSTGSFSDVGPADHGALFDFDFGALAAGDTKTWKVYYGAADTENAALNALSTIGIQAYSLGEPSTADGPTLGTPNTFFFAFAGIGGRDPLAPVANHDTVTATTGVAADVDVLANDISPTGSALSVTGHSTPTHGSVSCTSSGCTYTSDAGYLGPDSFTYTLSDGHGGTDTGTVDVTVGSAANGAPALNDDTATLAEDTVASLDVLANDTDPDSDPLTITGSTAASHGTATCSASSCSYTPAADYHGPDSFTYTVSDGHGHTATATVRLTVTAVNDAPVANGDSLTTAEDTAGSVSVTSNDLDADGDPLSVTGSTNGTHGTVSCTTSACTYTPAADFHGPDSFTYTVSDGQGGTATGTVTVTVSSVNDKPVAHADTLTTAEDTAGSVTVIANDTDVDGDSLSVTGSTNGAHGTVSCTATSCTYTPAADFHGPDSFTYTVSDGHGGTDTGTVSVTVTSVNDAPVANGDALTTAEDTAGSVSVTSNDTDVDADALAVTGSANGAHGTVSCTATSCTYTPAADFHGPDSFTYTVSDGQGGTATGTVTVTVTSVNDKPVAHADTSTTPEDTAGSISVLANDTDVDGDSLSVTGSTNGAHGTVSCTASSCTYTPSANYHGTDSFTYTVSDGHGGTDTGTVSVTVTSVNDRPVTHDDTLTTLQDTAGSVNVVGNDTDVDGDSLSVTTATNGAHGTVSCSTSACTYTPAAGYHGPDSFTYTVSDGQGGTATGNVSVTVTAVNSSPVAHDDTLTTAEDTAGSVSVLANDTDADGDPLAVTGKTNGAHGTVTCTTTTCTYTPAANYNGPDSFTYTETDGHGGTATGTVAVTVSPVNDAPVAHDDAVTTAEDTAATFNPTANDTDLDSASLAVVTVTAPTHGVLTCGAGGCTYTPAANYHGPDSFTYRATDGSLNSGVATVSITVTSVNDKPVVVDDSAGTDPGVAVTVPVLANDTDPDGDSLTVTGKTNGAHGTVTCTVSSCTYTPAAGAADLTDTFTYTAGDGHGGSAIGTVTVDVTRGNEPPVGTDDEVTTTEDHAATFDVLGNDADPDDDPLTVSDYTQPDGGTATCTTAGSCTYTPSLDFNGDDSFTYDVSDGQATTTVTVWITITPVNDAPVTVKDTLKVNEDSQASVSVLANDYDVDGDALTVSAKTNGAHGTVTCTTAGVCKYVPVHDFNGSDTFTYTANDGHGGKTVGTVKVTVVPVADRPGAPKDVTATRGKAGGALTVKVDWTKPSSDGGAAISNYLVSAVRLNTKGDVVWRKTFTVDGSTFTKTMTLASGRYKFKVAAKNVAGIGKYSAWTDAISPR